MPIESGEYETAIEHFQVALQQRPEELLCHPSYSQRIYLPKPKVQTLILQAMFCTNIATIGKPILPTGKRTLLYDDRKLNNKNKQFRT